MIPVPPLITSHNWDKIPVVQSGRGIVGYRGATRYQRGYGFGSILRSIFRVAKPAVKSAAKAIAKEGLESAALIGSDLMEGENLKTSLSKRAKEGTTNLVKKAADRFIPPQARGYKRLGGPKKKRAKAMSRNRQRGGSIGYKRKRKTKRKPKRQLGFGRKKYKRKGRKKPKSDYLGLIY